LDEHLVLELERRLDLLTQNTLVEDVLDANADTVNLVGIGGADPAPGGADLPLPKKALSDLVERAVVRGDHVRVGADLKLRGVEAAFVQGIELKLEHGEVDDDAVRDDRRDARR